MSRQKILITILVILLIIIGIVWMVYLKKIPTTTNSMNEFDSRDLSVEDNSQNADSGVNLEVANTLINFKKDVCENPNDPLAVSVFNDKLKNLSQEDIFTNFTKEALAYLNGYYFCSGLASNDFNEACNNKITSGDATTSQCKNGFYFAQMILASLGGDRVKAEEICKTNLGESEFCNYIGSFEDAKSADICSKAPEDGKANCYAFINGDDSRCKGSQQEDNCFIASDFLKIVGEKDLSKCNDLASLDLTNNYDVTCRLNISEKKDVCVTDEYAKFIQVFCVN